MSCGSIYKIVFPNGKHYIGLTTTSLKQRTNEHKRSAKSCDTRCLYNALRKYNIVDTFELIEIDTADRLDELYEKEIRYIVEYNSYYMNSNGYNMTHGGDGTNGYVYTDEDKQKNSEAQKKRFENPEERIKTSESQKKRFENPEERIKTSESQKKRFENPEERIKMSEAKKKYYEENPEARERASEISKKLWENTETREKMSEIKKKNDLKIQKKEKKIVKHKKNDLKIQKKEKKIVKHRRIVHQNKNIKAKRKEQIHLEKINKLMYLQLTEYL